MRATAESLEGNKVKLRVELDEVEVERAMEETYRRMAREVRVPGFRPGKVPRRLLEARLGSGTLRLEAIQAALPDYYERALVETETEAIAPPEIDITEGKEAGPLAFDAVVDIRPTVSVAGYDGLEVTVPVLGVSEEEIEDQLTRLRRREGRLEPVERPAQAGDHVTVDVVGSRDGTPVPGLELSGYDYEVGRGELGEELDAAFVGATTGQEVHAEAVAPDGGTVSYAATVRQVSEEILPEADDAWAAQASEFPSLEALRADIEARLAERKRAAVRSALRDLSLRALVGLVEDEPPAALVEAEVQRRLQDLARTLDAQRIPLSQYLQAVGTDVDGVVVALRAESVDAVKADLALRAVAGAAAIEVTEDDLDEEIVRAATEAKRPPAEVREQLERGGSLPALRSELRKRKALDLVVTNVSIVDEEGHPVRREELEEPAGGESTLAASPSSAEPGADVEAGAREAAGTEAAETDVEPAGEPAGEGSES